MGRRDLVTALALLGLALGYFSLTLTHTLDLFDEGYLLSRSAQVAFGAVPHRDFVDIYGPGVLASTGAALRLGGGELLAVRILVAVFKALAVLSGYALVRTFAPRWVAVLASLVAIAYWGRLAENLNTPYAAIFTIPIAQTALWLLIRAHDRPAAARFFAAGAVAGAAVVFKQSLGAMLVYGMALSVAAVALTRSRRDGATSGWARRAAVGAWLVAGALPLVPVASYLSERDYLLHFAPLHVVVVGVAWVATVRGAGDLADSLRTRVAPFAAGACVVPLAVLALYASWGGVPALVYDMFALPRLLRAYYTPAALPPPAVFVAVAGALALAAAGVRLAAGRGRAAAVAAAVGLAAIAVARLAIPTDLPRLFDPDVLFWRWPFALEGVLLPSLVLGGALLLALHARGGRAARARPEALLPVLVTSSLLCFEVFPRAAHNLWILHGALAPLFAWAVWGAVSLSMPPGDASHGRVARCVAAALAVAIPLWLVLPLVRTVVDPGPDRSDRRALSLPRTRGLSLGQGEIARRGLDDFERLVAYLRDAAPRDAPLVVLTNESAVPLFAGRRDLFEEHDYALFLAGWGMLPADDAARLDATRLAPLLARTPDALVVHRPEPTAQNRRRALPRVRDYVEESFRVVASFGEYRVLRRADRATVEAR